VFRWLVIFLLFWGEKLYHSIKSLRRLWCYCYCCCESVVFFLWGRPRNSLEKNLKNAVVVVEDLARVLHKELGSDKKKPTPVVSSGSIVLLLLFFVCACDLRCFLNIQCCWCCHIIKKKHHQLVVEDLLLLVLSFSRNLIFHQQQQPRDLFTRLRFKFNDILACRSNGHCKLQDYFSIVRRTLLFTWSLREKMFKVMIKRLRLHSNLH